MKVAAAAQWGTFCHEWAETGIVGDNLAYARLLHKKITQSKVVRGDLWPDDVGEHEVAMAYNVLERRAVRCVVPMGENPRTYRDAWKAAFDDAWITGTADFAGELLDEPWVDDLKTGRNLYPEQYRHQQGLYVLAWSLIRYGELREGRNTLTHWPKYPIAAIPVRVGRSYDLTYLKGLQEQLVELRNIILGARIAAEPKKVIPLIPGESQCRFCPSKQFCKFGEMYE